MELSLQNGFSELAQDCTELFFSLNPPVNQFLIRAHLCAALSNAPVNSKDEVQISMSAFHTMCCESHSNTIV